MEKRSLEVGDGKEAWWLSSSNGRALLDQMVFSWCQGLTLGPVIKKSREVLLLLNIMKNFLITRAAGFGFGSSVMEER